MFFQFYDVEVLLQIRLVDEVYNYIYVFFFGIVLQFFGEIFCFVVNGQFCVQFLIKAMFVC